MIVRAIENLRPNSAWRLDGNEYSDLVWLDENQQKPTLIEIQSEIERIEQLDSYQVPRSFAYPSVKDQLDMLWHAIDAGTLNKTSDFYKAIKAVKDAYPKSE